MIGAQFMELKSQEPGCCNKKLCSIEGAGDFIIMRI